MRLTSRNSRFVPRSPFDSYKSSSQLLKQEKLKQLPEFLPEMQNQNKNVSLIKNIVPPLYKSFGFFYHFLKQFHI
jgi:hypothetical protein